MTMRNTVGVAELKSRLSAYLRKVRRGHALIVLDRDTPVARLEPVAPAGAPLTVRQPVPGAPKPRDARLPPPLGVQVDVMALLAQERGER
jgi:prevent-host-death family protein